MIRFAAFVATVLVVSPAFADRVFSARAPRMDDDFEPDIPPMQPIARPVAVPSPETAALARAASGTFDCKGFWLEGNGGSTPMQMKIVTKLDLAAGWVSTIAPNAADYRSFDSVAKQWNRLRMLANSAFSIETSLGEQGGTWTWAGTEQSSTGTLQIRDFETPGKGTTRMWGEALLGGTWQKRYEMTCTIVVEKAEKK